MANTQPGKRQENGTRPVEISRLWKSNTPIALVCNWSDIDATAIRACIDAVTRAGGAVMLGLTSDGGAFSVCILHDQDKIKEYPHGKTECTAMLQALTEYFVDKIEI